MHSGARVSELITGGPLPADRLLHIGSALGEIIAAAHAEARPFGALAPATVFVADDGAVRALDAAHAPICARRDDDLLALGTLLYVMATGNAPYGAPYPRTGEAGATHSPRSPIELNPRLPSGLVELIQRSVHPDAARRFDTVAQIVTALGEVRRAPGSLESLLPAEHVSSSSRVKPPPRPSPDERARDEDAAAEEEAAEPGDEQERGLPFRHH